MEESKNERWNESKKKWKYECRYEWKKVRMKGGMKVKNNECMNVGMNGRKYEWKEEWK